jgi:hypothetical protein
MERNIAILCAPVLYYGTCAYETVLEFVEDIIDLTCCRTDLRLVNIFLSIYKETSIYYSSV